MKAEFNDNRPDGRPGFKWEEVAKQNAVRSIRCRSWKLTAQNGAVWTQNVWEAKGRLLAVML